MHDAFSLTGNLWLDNVVAAVAAVLVLLLAFTITSAVVRRFAGRYPIDLSGSRSRFLSPAQSPDG